ncbi:hypothetical protein AGR7A_pAt30064 [Agrobacterium deltaense NCPPB 1641]|uniref:Uncharacterized protein n=1 Tax=Agrobacterium deltaense NCPPB 1641 TaxID=1183425 RepID=A0A1S7UB21_9HYPH|nr:hypothetical protein AGR7A_pAt30064 [Agrobacterium deltaense NCPPB 1641]
MAPLTVTLETDLDLDEERDFDCELRGELALPEEVTDHLAENAEPAAGGAEELSEAFHTVSPCRCGYPGERMQTGKAGRTGWPEREWRTFSTPEFCTTRSRLRRGTFRWRKVAA